MTTALDGQVYQTTHLPRAALRDVHQSLVFWRLYFSSRMAEQPARGDPSCGVPEQRMLANASTDSHRQHERLWQVPH